MHRRAVSLPSIFAAVAIACGSPAEEAAAPPTPAAPPRAEETAVPVPGAEVAPTPAPAARLAIEAPADLASALRARRPTIELVPQSCPEELWRDRLCIHDADNHLVRAMRRVALSDLGAVSTVRVGDDVFFVAQDRVPPVTRFNFRVWQWRLRDDAYLGLAATDHEALGQLTATPFGALWGEYDETHSLLLTDGHATRVALEIEDIVSSARHVYQLTERDHVAELQRLEWDGSRFTPGPTVTFPGGRSSLYFPEGRDLVVTAVTEGRTTTLHVAEPPEPTRTLTIDVPGFRWVGSVDGVVTAFTETEACGVDLGTGAVSCGPLPPPPPELDTAQRDARLPLAFHAAFPTSDGIIVDTTYRRFRLSSEGVTRGPDAARAGRSPCHCEGNTLVCRDVRVALACTEVDELERVQVDEDPASSSPSTTFTGNGLFRIDVLEADLLRVTRLADGVRIWVRVLDRQGVLAQADDGAYVMPDETPLDAYALRWGRSLLDAPVTPLAPHREAFLRPTLIADFFAGRPLPSADTTLPE